MKSVRNIQFLIPIELVLCWKEKEKSGRFARKKRATLPTGPCIDETGRISCSTKRQTLPEGLPSIDPTLLSSSSLLLATLERDENLLERSEYLALCVSSAATPFVDDHEALFARETDSGKYIVTRRQEGRTKDCKDYGNDFDVASLCPSTGLAQRALYHAWFRSFHGLAKLRASCL